jgi:hypothetical protein
MTGEGELVHYFCLKNRILASRYNVYQGPSKGPQFDWKKRNRRKIVRALKLSLSNSSSNFSLENIIISRKTRKVEKTTLGARDCIYYI